MWGLGAGSGQNIGKDWNPLDSVSFHRPLSGCREEPLGEVRFVVAPQGIRVGGLGGGSEQNIRKGWVLSKHILKQTCQITHTNTPRRKRRGVRVVLCQRCLKSTHCFSNISKTSTIFFQNIRK